MKPLFGLLVVGYAISGFLVVHQGSELRASYQREAELIKADAELKASAQHLQEADAELKAANKALQNSQSKLIAADEQLKSSCNSFLRAWRGAQ